MPGTRRDNLLVVAVALAATGLALWFLGGRSEAAAAGDPLAHGHELFVTGCSSCHGVDGRGVTTTDGKNRGPSITETGEAGAFYELSTGRMPLSNSEATPARKRAAYNEADIADLVAYVGSLGNGPKLPTVDADRADLADGGVLFRANCAACHSASGAGGALSYGRAAPTLSEATPLQVASAMRTGPGQMPVFGEETFGRDDLDSVARYVQFLRSPDDRGGVPIGRTGPVPEGFVALTFGIGALLAAVVWIGTRSPARQRSPAEGDDTRGAT
ncbi:MAG: cytochrome bc1 complex diheme cytochrome c subunit [Acidimicrobiales bacterium]